MGMLDNIRNMFSSSKIAPIAPRDDSYEKAMVAEKIVDSINRIKRINSFDSSLWNLANVTVYDLQRRSLAELQKIQNTLNNRLSELSIQSQRENHGMDSAETSRWTGQRTAGMTAHDLDVWQRD